MSWTKLKIHWGRLTQGHPFDEEAQRESGNIILGQRLASHSESLISAGVAGAVDVGDTPDATCEKYPDDESKKDPF